MTQIADDVDIRIKNFMSKKMAQYPELEIKKGVKVSHEQRGYFFNNFISSISVKGLKSPMITSRS